MAITRIASILILLGSAIVSGCRCQSGCCLPATPSAPCPGVETAIANEPLDVFSLVSATEEADQRSLVELPSPGETYRRLQADECQCTAATNTAVANMIELERHWARVVIECDSKYVQRNMCLHRDILALWASKWRNNSAAEALTAYYQLAGLEARRHYLDKALEETSRSVRRVERFENLGLPVEIDGESLSIKESQLQEQALQLQFARLQLNGQLQKLLGCPIDETQFFWPEIDWSVDAPVVDANAAVAEGLSQRTDIRALQLLQCQLEKGTLRVARGVLAVADATLGSVEPTEGWVHRLRCICCNEAELPVRCRQIAMIYADTEQLATAEIKGAVYNIALQKQRVELARRGVEGRRNRLGELEEKRDVDDIPVFEISQARGALYEAESQLIECIVALRLAEVELRKTQGLIAIDCGFRPRLCSEGCCTGACMRCQPPTCPCPLPDCPCECKKK
ncbi:MAG: TolC family protein [Planctomycetales bacterium]|nr:TolC family protein [Planctomycetales bacterium]